MFLKPGTETGRKTEAEINSFVEIFVQPELQPIAENRLLSYFRNVRVQEPGI
jgi:hypothetical protein